MPALQALDYPPVPDNEFERLLEMSNYDIDFSHLENQFKDLTKLAAKIAGTEISLVNLIDSFSQWSVAAHGFPKGQMDREDSICQYTIMDEHPLEIKDLSQDPRFHEKFYVTDGHKLRYYLGIPLKTKEGNNLGALCVLDNKFKHISDEKVELLKIIADEIVNRFSLLRTIEEMKKDMTEIRENHKRVAHDIRGPIGGIIGLSKIIEDQGEENCMDEVLEFIHLIHNSGKSLLEMSDDILMQNFHSKSRPQINNQLEFNLFTLKEKIYDLYAAQAKQKEIILSVHLKSQNGDIPFSKNKLLHILGNIISNAIKFTPKYGEVEVHLSLSEQNDKNWMIAVIKDNGLGMSKQQISDVLSGSSKSKNGTIGEKGYGYGLSLVKHLVDKNNGELKIKSELGLYTQFLLRLPVEK